MTVENEQIVRKAYQLAEDKEAEAWAAMFTDDGTFTDMSVGATYTGSRLAEVVAGNAVAFPDMHRELHQMYSTGGIVVVQLALQGTHLGPLQMPVGRLPATGKRIDAPCADVFEVIDGKIKRFDCYPEASVVLSQLGVIDNISAVIELD